MEGKAVLLVVDVQIDFCPGGTLGVPGGDLIIPVINRYIRFFRQRGVPVIASRDWHPPVTSHFRGYGGIWPPHCIRESEGARFHPELRLPPDTMVVSKGTAPDRDDYSTFQAATDGGLRLDDHLDAAGIRSIYICGLATDYCVRETALDALKGGYAVTILTDAVRGVDLAPGDSKRALDEAERAGAKLADAGTFERQAGWE